MPIVDGDWGGGRELMARGPELDVRIFPPKVARDRLDGAGKPMPSVEALALIDTGATRTSIDRGIAEELGLRAHDERPVVTPSGGEVQPLYNVGVLIPLPPPGPVMVDIPVLGARLAHRHRVLIGRDILSQGTLIYSGRKGRFEFCL